MKQVIAYVRVSSEEQRKGYSIESQLQILRDYAKGHDLKIIQEVIETGSAWRLEKRPGFKAMLSTLKKNRSLYGVLCYKLDRIARNLTEYAQLAEKLKTNIISATEQLPGGSTGEFVRGISIVTARFYSSQLSERVELGMKTKAEKGGWIGLAPLGYLNQDGGIVPDPKKSHLIREMFEKYANSTLSITDLAAWVNMRGLRSRHGHLVPRSAVHQMLTNPIYYGAVRFRGRLYDGVHEPILSKRLFDRVQGRLHRGDTNRNPREFPFKGLLTCGYCGCNLTAEIKKGKYIYYHCTQARGECDQPWYRQEAISDRLAAVFEPLVVPEDEARALVEMSKQDDAERERKGRLLALRAEDQQLTDHRNSAYLEKLEGVIGEARWSAIDRRLGQQQELVAAEITRLSKPQPSLDGLSATLELLHRLPEAYYSASHEKRARMLRCVLSNCIIDAENIKPVYLPAFRGMVDRAGHPGKWAWLDDIRTLLEFIGLAEDLDRL